MKSKTIFSVTKPSREETFKRHGVYKMTINGTWFYIGGSVNLHSRIICWVTMIKLNRFKNKNIRQLLPDIQQIDFKILEYVENKMSVKHIEDRHIKEHIGNELFLNRCPSAFDCSGRIPFAPEVKPKREKLPSTPPSPIVRYDINGKVIQVHESIGAVARFFNVKRREVEKVVGRHRKLTLKGFLLAKINPDGTIPAPPTRKNSGNKKGFVTSETTKAKIRLALSKVDRACFRNNMIKVSQFDLFGNHIADYGSIREASAAVKSNETNLGAHLKGRRYKSIKGFIFKITAQ